jgi:hypothetical protein
VAVVPRYIVERSFPEGFELPFGQSGIDVCRGVVGINEDLGVTWLHSYVRDDRRSTFCVYDAPNPEAIRRAADRNGLPVDRITRVTVLDPYFYTPSAMDEQTPEVKRMAKFMDVHNGFFGVSAEQLAEAHSRDLAIQDDEGVVYERAWLDPEAGKVFCLATGPSKEAVMRIHERAGHPTPEVYEVTVEV